jgi:hypothetical protein
VPSGGGGKATSKEVLQKPHAALATSKTLVKASGGSKTEVKASGGSSEASRLANMAQRTQNFWASKYYMESLEAKKQSNMTHKAKAKVTGSSKSQLATQGKKKSWPDCQSGACSRECNGSGLRGYHQDEREP